MYCSPVVSCRMYFLGPNSSKFATSTSPQTWRSQLSVLICSLQPSDLLYSSSQNLHFLREKKKNFLLCLSVYAYWILTRECKHFPFANVIFKQWRFYSLQKYTGDTSQHLGKMESAKEIAQGKENPPHTWDPLCMVILLHFLRLRPKEEHCCSGGGKNGDGKDLPHVHARRKPLGSTCVSFPSLPLCGLTFSWAR